MAAVAVAAAAAATASRCFFSAAFFARFMAALCFFVGRGAGLLGAAAAFEEILELVRAMMRILDLEVGKE